MTNGSGRTVEDTADITGDGMARQLCDRVRLCDNPEDEDAMVGILQLLFKQPRVSKQVEAREYYKIFEQHDILSLPALARVNEQVLEGLGVSVGHALALVAALFVQQPVAAAQPVQQVTAAGENRVSRQRRPEVKWFPDLLSTGFPEVLSWTTFRPNVTVQLRDQISEEYSALVQQVLYEPSRDLPADFSAADPNNAVVFDVLLTMGTGMPQELVRELPQEMLAGSDGVGILHTIGRTVFAISDGAAEMVTEWLNNPPTVTQAKRHTLGQYVRELKRQLARAEAMGCGLAPVAKRLVLKKVATGVEDVRVQMAALRASNNNREPTYDVALDAVEQLALTYAAEQLKVPNSRWRF